MKSLSLEILVVSGQNGNGAYEGDTGEIRILRNSSKPINGQIKRVGLVAEGESGAGDQVLVLIV